MTRKSDRFPLFSVSLALLFHASFFSSIYSQPRIFENGEKTLIGTDTGIHLDTPTRTKIDLAGVWSYSLDGETWADVKIPSSFDLEGRMTFVRKFAIDEQLLASSAFKLVALGINYDAEIYVNDLFIGKHVGGYTTIEIEIPENTLQLGSENAIKVVVNNVLGSRSTVPLRKQIWGWRNYGGILRDIYLLAMPKVWIDGMRIQTDTSPDLRSATVRVRAVLNSRPLDQATDSTSVRVRSTQPMFQLELVEKFSGATVAVSPPSPVTILPNRDIEVTATLSLASPKLWSPEEPELYLLKASIVVPHGRQLRLIDEKARNVGFRRVELRDGAFVVNGRRVVLNGVLWHEDSPRFGASLSYEQMEKDIALVKMMGANAVRFTFHPPHPYMLNLCNRYGLFALVELPVWNVPGEILEQDAFAGLAEAMATEMVQRDHSHPSVLAWGVGNDIDLADRRSLVYAERLVAAVKRLDSRPVYLGSLIASGQTGVEGVDFIAVNVTTSDLRTFREQIAAVKARHAEEPIVILRYGKEVEPGNRNGYSDPMSQEAQGKFFEKFYGAIKEAKLAGSFICSFADWRGDRPIMTVNTNEPYLYPMGLVSYEREKRASYDIVKSLYHNEKLTSLPIGRYRASFPIAHIIYGFTVIFVVAYVYHYNRRFNETFKRSLLRPFNFFADLRDVHSVSVPQTILVAAAVAVTLGVVLSGILYHYRTDMVADYVITQFVVSDVVKEWLIYAAWNPLQGIAAFTLVFLTYVPLAALCIKVGSIFVKTRIYWYHAFAVAVWGTLPLVLLSPLGMALFKLLQTELYVLPAFLIIALFIVWAFLRVLKGVSVIYDVSPFRAYAGGMAFLLLLFGGLFVSYESAYAISAYVELMVHIVRSFG